MTAPSTLNRAMALAAAYMAHNDLLSLRLTSKDLQDAADAELFAHIVIDYEDRQWRPTLRGTGMVRRLPLAWEDEDARWADRLRWADKLLAHTRVLDVRYANAGDTEVGRGLTGLRTVRHLVNHLEDPQASIVPRAFRRTVTDVVSFAVLTPLGSIAGEARKDEAVGINH